MSHKTAKIASLIHAHQGGELDAHYVSYFECFNRQLFFEAHEVLEELWLPHRGQPNDLFYKGLIQLAGAFVHVQKNRRQPAIALLKLAQVNLSRYPSLYESLDIGTVQNLIRGWMVRLETDAQFRDTLELGCWPNLIAPQQTGGPEECEMRPSNRPEK